MSELQQGDRAYLGVIVEQVLPTAIHVRLEGTEVVLRVPSVYRRRPGQGLMELVEAVPKDRRPQVRNGVCQCGCHNIAMQLDRGGCNNCIHNHPTAKCADGKCESEW